MREKLIELLDGWDCPILLAVCESESLVDYLIANGVTVREKGEWHTLTECSNEGVYCSVCHKKVYKADYAWCNKKNKVRSDFCPNCGADMRGAEHERNMFELLKEKEQRRQETFPYIVIGLPDAPKDGE